MARVLFVSSDQAGGPARAHALGCGYLPAVPGGITATPPCAILVGGSPIAAVVIPEPTTAGAVATALAPLLAQEATLAAADTAAQANAQTLRSRGVAALATNITYLALGAPSVAQNTAQLQALTRECSAILRLLLQQLDTLTGA